ncbi:hypothetical protein STRAU_7335 [Streptomyces aurantiacus JA 4570]|uniref:Uncharacterized protein n=1 Tax=Streptomyces aurantiacus JA 4570 TaxID=1286094 RepID=S3ZAM7_9ACTN|nr:hypothetical protein STRAU_7335 [Streptomyces aurantiacus JA 4570]
MTPPSRPGREAVAPRPGVVQHRTGAAECLR